MDEDVKQNLIDAGCDDEDLEKYDCCCDKKDELKMLECHRKMLLDKLHKCNKQIDCLDYLVYKLNKKEKENGKKGD